MARIKRLSIWQEREEIGLVKPKSVTPIKQVKGIAIHHAGGSMLPPKKQEREASKVKAIQKYHMETNKWSDIAYNFLVGNSGTIYEGRGIDIRPASQGTKDGNDYYLSVCWLGDATKYLVSDKALMGINLLIDDLERIYNLDFEVKAHRDFKDTECPGDALYKWISKGRPSPKARLDDVLEQIRTKGYYIV